MKWKAHHCSIEECVQQNQFFGGLNVKVDKIDVHNLKISQLI